MAEGASWNAQLCPGLGWEESWEAREPAPLSPPASSLPAHMPLLTGLSQPPEGLSLLPPAPRRCGLLELIPPQPKCAESGFKVFLQGHVSRFIFHYREDTSLPLLQPPNSQLFPPAWPRLHPQEQVPRTREVTVPWAGAVLQGGRQGGGCARPAGSAGQTPGRADSYLGRE